MFDEPAIKSFELPVTIWSLADFLRHPRYSRDALSRAKRAKRGRAAQGLAQVPTTTAPPRSSATPGQGTGSAAGEPNGAGAETANGHARGATVQGSARWRRWHSVWQKRCEVA